MPDSAPSILERILADKQREVAQRKEKEPIEVLKRRIPELDPQWSLMRAILEGPRGPLSGGKRVQLIAEVKKASPSRGRLVARLEHLALARTYTIGGAAGISVVTEEKHFQGSLSFLSDIRWSLKGYYPGGRPSLLRKDFLFDPYQLWESRAYGADAVLLIVAILDDARLRELLALARELEMDALVEVHDEEEVRRALDAGAELIGINNRDLRTFETDLATTERLRPLIPADRCVVSESGIFTRADVERLADCGVHAVLVGEALITSNDVRNKMREFLV
ncbi:MAG TPA: indole-3-glycerol phosphate synthase TrpC [Dehalococcoidia bacterium]|nr:indole-3-glycerol phosphate synthase TrpC [Dehalococcoidia bacterium]